jgi:CubicO group peptidase (beta-lactamase class C family)
VLVSVPRQSLLVASLVACALHGLAVCHALGAQQRPPAPSIASLDHALDSLRLRLKIPGLSAALVYDDHVIWSRGYGFADLEGRVSAEPQTPYEVASVSKPIASVLLMRLVEQGKVSLDDPMSKYSTDYHGDSIHVRHVLTHTSEGVPGEHFEYNGDVFATLFDVIVKASGRRYRELISSDIMRPLGMTNSSPGNDLAARQPAMVELLGADADARYVAAMQRLAKPYHVDSAGRNAPSHETIFGLSPANGIVTSVLDLAKFDSALDRHAFLRQETETLMWTPARTSKGERLPYALGWFVQDYVGEHLIWHNGNLPGRYSALYLKVPDKKLTLLLLANSDALSSPFQLAKGDLSRSAFACAFLLRVIGIVDDALSSCAIRSEAAIRAWITATTPHPNS